MLDPEPQISDFAAEAIRRYDDLKLQVGAIAQTALLQCAKAKDEEGERDFQQLLARLAEDRFNLAVVGPFNRGKSSLMNAILGFDVLPTGVLPHTSVITTVTYGPRERVLLWCAGWPFPQEIPLKQLEEYVTERGNPGNRRRVSLAEIQVPAEILRRGLHFIDTPGVGSAILANTDTTEKFLPEIDAAIFVSSFDSAVSEGDLEFLARVRETVGVVFFVLNKMDLVSNSERGEVARFVEERLERDPRVGQCTLFSVSAKRALEAKLAGDQEALGRSGLPELEAALGYFLRTDKTRQLSSRIVDRLIACLQRQQAVAELIFGANESATHRENAFKDLDARVAELKGHLHDYSARLEMLADSTLRALKPRIDDIFQRLKDDLLKNFESKLSSGSFFLNPATLNLWARDVPALCREAFARELPSYEDALNNEWQVQGGALLAKIQGLPDELLKLSPNDNDLADGVHTARDGKVGFEFRKEQFAPANWQLQLKWRRSVVPMRWFSAALRKQAAEQLDGVLNEYRYRVESAVRNEISRSIRDLTRETEKSIDARAARIKQPSAIESATQDRARLDQLMQRALSLKRNLGGQSQSAITTGANRRMEGGREVPIRDGLLRSFWACPICRKTVEAVMKHLSILQYELSTETSAQKDHALKGGFCATHTWIYSSLTSPVGISRAYPALADSQAARLESAASSANSLQELTRQVADISPSQRNCRICELSDRTANDAIGKVISELNPDNPLATPTLCVPHVELALRRGANLESGRLLVRSTARALSRLADNMRRYGLKHDALRRDLMTADERKAGQIGLRKLVGEMFLVLPPHEDEHL